MKSERVVNTSAMYLVYEASDGEQHFQLWSDVVESGTLTDPETGADMPIVGWSTK